MQPTPPTAELAGFLLGRRVLVLTGAGCSTESGIPDYRGPAGSLKKRRPVQFLEFVRQEEARRRYWARSLVGWRTFARAQPNAAHHALAELERRGTVVGVITQNVDGLHGAAGSARVVELHGSLHRVTCLSCGARLRRDELQEELERLNPASAGWGAELAPDGDAELSPEAVRDFRVAPCPTCSGVLKPDVVFFGENVPPPIVERAWALFEGAEALLVVGSSLFVYSGLRFVRGAAERGLPIAIVNQGETRGDELARLRVDAACGEVLPALLAG
jgi:NAD+-dependent protein deacetylase sirtuin 4